MTEQPVSRRDELLVLAATMFAERGLRATTVRDIADAAVFLVSDEASWVSGTTMWVDSGEANLGYPNLAQIVGGG